MKHLRIDGARLWDSIMQMAEIGATAGGGSCRLALSDEDAAGRALFVKWCEAAGYPVAVDSMGNLFARQAGRTADAPAVATGSHLDTQPHGGRFDGIYGVLAGLEVVRTLNDAGVTTKLPLEVVCWTNEEGARFAPAMLGSGVFAGVFELDYALARVDSAGISVGDELARTGYAGAEVCGTHPLSALLEAHIEQGPILEAAGETIGVVVGAQGFRWYDLTVLGQDSHAGSTPMLGRRDALAAAAEVVLVAEELAIKFAPDGRGTVGEIRVLPNSRNTIAGAVEMAADLRHPQVEFLAKMDRKFRREVARITAARTVEIAVREIWYAPPVEFNTDVVSAVQAAAESLGYAHRRMVSGAGHDACQVARQVPTAMIFVPCAGGVSHNEAESATPEDLEAGANVLLQAVLQLAGG